MKRRRTTFKPRRTWSKNTLIGIGVLLLLALLLPTPALAGKCSDPLPDLGACLDGATYEVWRSVATTFWAIDRAILATSYWILVVRDWLVNAAFLTLFNQIRGFLGPFLSPLFLLAAMLWAVMQMALPLLQVRNYFNIGHIFLWALLSGILLANMGTWFGAFDDWRMQLSQDFFGIASGLTMPTTGGGGGGVMGAVHLSEPESASPDSLYPSQMCGGHTYDRGVTGSGFVDDLAARYFWADAEDIHCPTRDILPMPTTSPMPGMTFQGWMRCSWMKQMGSAMLPIPPIERNDSSCFRKQRCDSSSASFLRCNQCRPPPFPLSSVSRSSSSGSHFPLCSCSSPSSRMPRPWERCSRRR